MKFGQLYRSGIITSTQKRLRKSQGLAYLVRSSGRALALAEYQECVLDGSISLNVGKFKFGPPKKLSWLEGANMSLKLSEDGMLLRSKWCSVVK